MRVFEEKCIWLVLTYTDIHGKLSNLDAIQIRISGKTKSKAKLEKIDM